MRVAPASHPGSRWRFRRISRNNVRRSRQQVSGASISTKLSRARANKRRGSSRIQFGSRAGVVIGNAFREAEPTSSTSTLHNKLGKLSNAAARARRAASPYRGKSFHRRFAPSPCTNRRRHNEICPCSKHDEMFARERFPTVSSIESGWPQRSGRR